MQVSNDLEMEWRRFIRMTVAKQEFVGERGVRPDLYDHTFFVSQTMFVHAQERQPARPICARP